MTCLKKGFALAFGVAVGSLVITVFTASDPVAVAGAGAGLLGLTYGLLAGFAAGASLFAPPAAPERRK
jgi:hypothetical protein